MSVEVVQAILRRASEDREFRRRLATDPDAALIPYRERLTEKEWTSISSIDSELIDVLSGLRAPAGGWRGALVPSSFKEAGALLLTGVLALTFVGMLIVTLVSVGTDPRGVSIGDTTQPVDEFGRAKDLLNVVVPLFGAAVTFWLGVAVESRRADDNQRRKRPRPRPASSPRSRSGLSARPRSGR